MISYRGHPKNVVLEIIKPIKLGFRPYILAGLNIGYTYKMKLLEPIEEKENNTKIYISS